MQGMGDSDNMQSLGVIMTETNHSSGWTRDMIPRSMLAHGTQWRDAKGVSYYCAVHNDWHALVEVKQECEMPSSEHL
jgi:hypothetical protein